MKTNAHRLDALYTYWRNLTTSEHTLWVDGEVRMTSAASRDLCPKERRRFARVARDCTTVEEAEALKYELFGHPTTTEKRLFSRKPYAG